MRMETIFISVAITLGLILLNAVENDQIEKTSYRLGYAEAKAGLEARK